MKQWLTQEESKLSEKKARIAQALLSAGVVGFVFDSPRTFKSGLKSPVYLDNRKLLMHPEAWHMVIGELKETVESLRITQPVIAGIETAGIPHSAALAYAMGLPTVFVRKQAKEHGLQQRIEGGDVRGREVVLIEDQITTGGSSLSSVFPLREAGATVNHCLAITSYGFAESSRAFAAADVIPHVMITFADLLPEIRRAGLLPEERVAEIELWLTDPLAWAAQRNT
ncbi:MAG: orotate phosphoribosyltransferase [Chloroflexi bacterium]|nr:orotate phosphoribosyltransferase [Chloroflexota bacterium]